MAWATSFNIAHNLGTEDVLVMVRKTTVPKDVVVCDVTIVDAKQHHAGVCSCAAFERDRVVVL